LVVVVVFMVVVLLLLALSLVMFVLRSPTELRA